MIINTIDNIRDACMAHGAKQVYDAAHARMSGAREALPGVGLLDGEKMDDASHVASVAFAIMGGADRAADAASAVIGLVKHG